MEPPSSTLATSSQIRTRYFASWFNERGGPSVYVPRLCELVITKLVQLQPFEVDLTQGSNKSSSGFINLVVNMEVVC